MNCPQCGSGNTIHVKLEDGEETVQCNDCGTKMTVQKSVSVNNTLNKVTEISKIQTSMGTAKRMFTKDSVSKKIDAVKVWIKNPISIIFAVTSCVLLVVSIVMLILLCNSDISANDEVKNYALTNGYELADFDKFNSPAEENGLANTKIYFYGKIKDLTKAGTYNVALLEEIDNPQNVWAVMFFDNDNYSKFSQGKKAIVFGYYQGYSSSFNVPFLFYSNSYIDGKWYEYEDTLGIFNVLENQKTSNLIINGEFAVDKDGMVDAINTINNVVYIPIELEGGDLTLYAGQVAEGVKCTIVCDDSGEKIKAVQIESKADSSSSYNAGAFLSNLIKLFDSDNYEKNIDRLLEKIDFDNLRYGDTKSCVISDMFYNCDYTQKDKIIISIMPT